MCFSSIILFTRRFGKLRYDLTSILTGSNLSYGVSWALAVGGEKKQQGKQNALSRNRLE